MNKGILYLISIFFISVLVVLFTIIDGKTYKQKYDTASYTTASYNSDIPSYELTGFSSTYAVIDADSEINSELFSSNTYATILVNNKNNTCLVAHNALRRIYPASMTKLVTAMVVCDAINDGKINLEDEVTLTHKITFDESGVMASNLDKGCKITVRNLLYGLLMKSYNDYAVILAEYTAGSVDDFAVLMNQKAYEIGATNSHFVNPHGLHNDDHYVTAYDMYMIIKTASTYDMIKEIDSYKSFSYKYKDANGNEVQADITPTNSFLSNKATLPSNIYMEAWKTGTTSMAGHCISMNIDIDGTDYSLVVCDSVSGADLYNSVGMLFNFAK